MANFKTRLIAYILDALIISVAVTLISSIFPNSNYKKLNDELNKVTENYTNKEIDFATYVYNYADINQDMMKESLYTNLIQGFLIVGYFIILPVCNNGQTLGKKLFKIKMVSDKGELDYNQLIIRALIVDGLGYLILSMALLYILPSYAYFITTSILSLVETLVTIISVGMIIKNDNRKGIHDILSGTKVISEVGE